MEALAVSGWIDCHTNVPSLGENDPQKEAKEKESGASPAIGSEGSRSVEIGLVLLEDHIVISTGLGNIAPRLDHHSTRDMEELTMKCHHSTVNTATHPGQLRGLRRDCHERSLFGFGDIHGCEFKTENNRCSQDCCCTRSKGTTTRVSIAMENKVKCRLKH